MPNMCSNGIIFTGPANILHIAIEMLRTQVKIADIKQEGFKFPHAESYDKASYIFSVCIEKNDEQISFETKWSNDPVSPAIFAEAFGLSFEMWSSEPSCALEAEYRYSPENGLEFRELTEEEHGDEVDDDGNIIEDINNIRDNRLSAKAWESYDMDVSLLKRMVA